MLKAYPLFPFLLFVALLYSCQAPDPMSSIPEGEGFKSINGTQLYYKVTGTGEPVVVLHGGPLLDHSYLWPQMEMLTQKYQLIFFDQRLCGRSEAEVDSSSVSMDNFVEDIEGIRKAFALDKMNLMAHSWGGLPAMHYAIKYPDRLKSLILLNSIAASSSLWREEQIVLARRFTKEDSIAQSAIFQSEAFAQNRPQAFADLLRLSFRKQFHNPDQADSLNLYIPEDYRQRSALFSLVGPELAGFDLHEQLKNINCPVLLIYGSQEASATVAAPALDDAFPHSTLVIIPDCGHFPYIEQPEAFKEALFRFLSKS